MVAITQTTATGVGLFDGATLLVDWNDTTVTVTDNRTTPPTSRPYTAEETAQATARQAATTAAANAATLRTRATTALNNNATYQGLTNPTNAQVAAQVAALTRQVNALIRLEISQLDSLNGA